MQRNTVQRRFILSTVQNMHNHPTAADVYDSVTEICPGISRATVYRVLGTLVEEGEILLVPIADGADRYDFTLGEHAHFYCRGCGKVMDLPLETNPVAKDGDFKIERLTLTASGLCPDCASANNN